ncbi:MAG: hypothetical protein AAFZ15_07560 [Bacteroidota bacterium]
MNQLLNALHRFFHNTKLYIKALKINVLVFLLVYVVFIATSQSIDLFNGLIADQDFSALILFWFSVTLLSIIMWYSSIHFLIRYDLRNIEKGSISQHKIVRWLPVVAGISTYLVILYGFNQEEVLENNMGWFYLIAGAVVIVLIDYFRDRYIAKNNFLKGEENRDLIASRIREDESWNFLSAPDQYIIVGSCILIAAILLFSVSISFSEIKPVGIPLYFRASTLICFFFSGFIMVLLFLWSAVGYKWFKMLMIVLVIIVAIFSAFNNNHHIRLTEKNITEKVNVKDDFSQWLGDRLGDTVRFTGNRKIPIFLIAAEGGGIRSMKWTALVLQNLFDGDPNFRRYTYALSGVSGGSVGIVFQQAVLGSCSNNCRDKLDVALSEDFLSPVTFGLLFPDNAQSVVPFPINAWDRSRWLEDSWHCAFKNSFNSDVLGMAITDYWQPGNHSMPNIFLNSIALETGQKVIISNLTLPVDYFKNIIDLGTEITEGKYPGKIVPLKTAASLSARFPLVTSAGKVNIRNGSINIADGGYHDNTGLETISQLINMMAHSTDPDLLANFQISVVFIKNGIDMDKTDVQSSDFLVGLNTPLEAFLNNWNDKAASTVDNFSIAMEVYRKYGINVDFSIFELDRNVRKNENGEIVFGEEEGKKVNLPLGWYLSKSSNKEISRQAGILNSDEFDPETTRDQVGAANYRVFQKIMDQVK